MKAGILTLGCKVNQYESESIAEALEKIGIEPGNFSEKCDVYIINTCAVTDESVRKSRQMVRRAMKNNPGAFVAVTGCASQLDREKFGAIPGVSFVCGTRNKNSVVAAVEAYFKSEALPFEKITVVPPIGNIEKTAISRFDRTRAYVKIQDGCDGKCAYCVIPSLRGNIVSRSEDEIIAEVKKLAANGCREVVLTGIETASYGNGLAELMTEIDRIDGIERIRLGSMEPSFMKPSFIDSVSPLVSLAHHFHLSVQNGSDHILAAMRRKYNASMLEANISYIRSKLTDVNFSADIIVGFPGETDSDFAQTRALVKKLRFLHLHIFTYSKRPGTPAADMKNQVPDHVKTERMHILESLQKQIKSDHLDKIISAGKPLLILAESAVGGMLTGHTGNFVECGIPVSSLTNPAEYYRGKFMTVHPVSHNGEIVFGKIV